MSEKDFSNKLVAYMRTRGWHVQQIESHLTARGIPDLYVECPYGCNWIELKYDKREWDWVKEANEVEVQWRSGQQAWMWRKYEASVKTRPCWTFVMFADNKVLAIKMDRMFKDNKIVSGDVICELGTIKELMDNAIAIGLFY